MVRFTAICEQRHILELARTAEQRGQAKGEVKGRAEGEAIGEVKGQARTLLRLLERRFGPITDRVRARVSGADLDAIDQWLDRVLEAPTLDAVFDQAKTH